jgi:hypothetical protein
MSGPSPFNSARSLIASYFGAEIRLQPYESDYSVSTTALQIGKRANQRAALYLANTGATVIAFALNSGVTTTTGLILNPTQSVTFTWFLDGEIVALDWYAISSGAGSTLHVIESVLSVVN